MPACILLELERPTGIIGRPALNNPVIPYLNPFPEAVLYGHIYGLQIAAKTLADLHKRPQSRGGFWTLATPDSPGKIVTDGSNAPIGIARDPQDYEFPLLALVSTWDDRCWLNNALLTERTHVGDAEDGLWATPLSLLAEGLVEIVSYRLPQKSRESGQFPLLP